MAHAAPVKQLTIFDLQARVDREEKVFQVTAVDFPTAQQGIVPGRIAAGKILFCTTWSACANGLLRTSSNAVPIAGT